MCDLFDYEKWVIARTNEKKFGSKTVQELPKTDIDSMCMFTFENHITKICKKAY